MIKLKDILLESDGEELDILVPRRSNQDRVKNYQIAVNKKNYHLGRFDNIEVAANVINEFRKITQNLKKDVSKLFSTNPLLNCLKYKDIYIDEFHELLTVDKYNFILKLIRLLHADNKWVLTGTPFDKSDDCLSEMLDFVTDYKVPNIDSLIENNSIRNYILNNFFRKNTKLSVKNENELKIKIIESVKVLLNDYSSLSKKFANEDFLIYLNDLKELLIDNFNKDLIKESIFNLNKNYEYFDKSELFK